MSVPRVLTIAGTDPTGGAGLQADLKAIAAHDGYGMGVVTALVAQNTTGVRAVHLPATTFLREQLDAVSDDVTIDAVKVGMLGTAEVVSTVTSWLAEHRPPVVVVDPVMVATSGDRLLSVDAEAALTDLFAHADLLTPNRAELGVLADLARRTTSAGATADGDAAPDDAALVARTWDVLVLAKGGHDDGPTSDDVLVSPDGSSRVFRGPRIRTANTHGTGCSLSSAIATLAARHGDWELAVGAAKRWLTTALEHADALDVGAGNGPVDHGAATRAALPPVPWTRTWWEDVADVRDATLAGEFLRRLADGTLPPPVFDAYLAQDVHYLRTYERHLRTLADRSSGAAATFWRTAADGCAAEARDLHHRRLGDAHADDPVHPVCAGYLAHLQAAADSGSTAVLAAAVLPCFRVYAWVGTRLGVAPEGHPYADWVSAYGDPGFAAASAEATEQVERLAAVATAEERGRMARAHRRSTVWEEAFFRMAL
ncbi:bifunctional hydroxymethylpyrimidine kinase/phosphomethylpyrimidine kinase [Curtobacterium sp. 458]|uniref:bifunctional hydroxymethylpyrimidine kinase/phosphomethylpyrimidine kinase n=1 Tax=Curtobacterium sp. 458 TaxID=3050069 RepID=UPI0025B45DC0|nr:bifunctional hydroxymethylpyrimidine kinase/phosphomethylpyrimidine kinase [Curtobacterium sp. 458]WJX99800.1 bifunctional hydroxymethylpyrimidine kinase/phosphomethylpyrimidine kinase [Curtobacterium sp. 458]